MEKKSECSNREKKHLIDSRFITTAQGFTIFILILKISTWKDSCYIQAYFLYNISWSWQFRSIDNKLEELKKSGVENRKQKLSKSSGVKEIELQDETVNYI